MFSKGTDRTMARKREEAEFAGVSSPYVAPTEPALWLHTPRFPQNEAVAQLRS